MTDDSAGAETCFRGLNASPWLRTRKPLVDEGVVNEVVAPEHSRKSPAQVDDGIAPWIAAGRRPVASG